MINLNVYFNAVNFHLFLTSSWNGDLMPQEIGSTPQRNHQKISCFAGMALYCDTGKLEKRKFRDLSCMIALKQSPKRFCSLMVEWEVVVGMSIQMGGEALLAEGHKASNKGIQWGWVEEAKESSEEAKAL